MTIARIRLNDIVISEDMREYCKPCPNFNRNWSCPPSSYTAVRLRDKLSMYAHFYLVYIKIPNQKTPLGNMLFDNSRWYGTKLKSRLYKELKPYFNNERFILGGGACGKCRPCNKKKGLPCADTPLMAMESCGINVFETMARIGIVLEHKPLKVAYQVGLICTNHVIHGKKQKQLVP